MTDSSFFSCLPNAVRDRLLQQVFQQFDERHLFGVAPRVCRLWHQLSLSVITSLDVTISTAGAAEQLSLWVQNYGTSLQSLKLLRAKAVPRLCSLNISTPQGYDPSQDLSLTMLTKLTSLRITSCSFKAATKGSLRDSIPHLTTLKRLSLDAISSGSPWQPFMQQISTRLVQLTSLELGGMWDVEATDIAVLRALPQLQQLQLNFPIPARDLSKLGSLPVTVIRVSMYQSYSDAGICSWLRQSAANLRELALKMDYFSSNAPPPPLVPLQQALQLRDLAIVGLQPNMTEVAALTQLTRLALESCGLDDIAVCTVNPV